MRELLMIEIQTNTADEWNGLGVKYYNGSDNRMPDYTKARFSFEEALRLDSKHCYAHYNLGQIYKGGLGVASDMNKAETYFVTSAAQGFKDAKYELLRLPNSKWVSWILLGNVDHPFMFAAYDQVDKVIDCLTLPEGNRFDINAQYVDFSDTTSKVLDKVLHEPKTVLGLLAASGLLFASGGTAFALLGGIISSFGLTGGMSVGIDAIVQSREKFLVPYYKLGWTLLHFAAATGAQRVALELIARNANVNILDAESRDFLAIARAEGHNDFVAACQGAINVRGQIQAGANNVLQQINQQLAGVNAALARIEPVLQVPGDGQFFFRPEAGVELQDRRLNPVARRGTIGLFAWRDPILLQQGVPLEEKPGVQQQRAL